MKRIGTSTIIAAFASVAAALSTTSCDALWGTSVDIGSSPDDYYYGWDGEWLPTLAGNPVYSPYYWGGTSYPIGNWQPVHRPGYNPWGAPVGPAPSRPNRPQGNLRPGMGQPNQQPQRPPQNNQIVPSKPINMGSNPGIQLPPAGSGLKYDGQSQGRH